MRYYPSVEALQKSRASDGVLFTTHRSYRSSISFVILFIISSAVLTYLWRNHGDWRLAETGVASYFSVRWLIVFPLYFLFELLRRRVDDLYEFEIHHLRCKGGRLSLNYIVPMMKYIDVRSIRVRQSIFGRMFNYGDLEISTAAQDETEVWLQGICAPRELARLVDDMRQISNDLLHAELSLRSQEENSSKNSRRVVQSRPPATKV